MQTTSGYSTNSGHITSGAEYWTESGDTPGITDGSLPMNGRCANGDDCVQLYRVLDACRDITKLHDVKQLDIVYDMDHCLLFHADVRRFEPPDWCQNAECCKKFSKSDGVNRFIQFHRQIYHDEPIGITDIAEIEIDQKEEDQIGYEHIKSDCNSRRIEFGQPFLITNEEDAKHRGLKEEFLYNDYHKMTKEEWMTLVRYCNIYSKYNKKERYDLKELIAMKLYTDYDDLQSHFRRCFREKDLEERENLQRNFFHWNKWLESACKRGQKKVTGKLYHGVNDEKLSTSTFSGTYYGLL